MSTEQSDAWVANLRSIIKDFREQIDRTYACVPAMADPSKRDQHAKAVVELKAQFEGLRRMFGKDTTPPIISEIKAAIQDWTAHVDHAPYVRRMFSIYAQLDSLATFNDDLSFEQIFESYKNDGELQKLVDELIVLLKRILEEGEDSLSSHMAKELESLLIEIEKKKDRSIIDLKQWIDLTFVSLAAIADAANANAGYPWPIYSIIVNAGLTAHKTRAQLHRLFLCAQQRLLSRPALRKLPAVAANLPLPPPEASDDEVKLFLEAKRPLLTLSDSAKPQQSQ